MNGLDLWQNPNNLIFWFFSFFSFFFFLQKSGLVTFLTLWLLKFVQKIWKNPASIYLLRVSHTNTRIKCEICSKLTKHENKVSEANLVFIVNFQHISHLSLMFLILRAWIKKYFLCYFGWIVYALKWFLYSKPWMLSFKCDTLRRGCVSC